MSTPREASKACEDPESDSNSNGNVSTETQRNGSTKCPSESGPAHSAEQALDAAITRIQKQEKTAIFESKEVTDTRRRIISEVEKITTAWIRHCLELHCSLPAARIEESVSCIRAFGSFELNVHFESSDIDLLCIGPKFVTRDMLFKELVEMLEADTRVSDILQLRHVFVPLLKFTFEGVDIDLVYAQWDIDVIRAESRQNIDVFSNAYVKDHDTLLCLNGVRSTETIKKLIPNKALFEKTLRFVKLWAQRRAIYSNVMGYLGGISWSIMTAKICIQHPAATNCVQLIRAFFAAYHDMHLDDELEDSDEDYEGQQGPCIQLDTELFDHLYHDHDHHVNHSKHARYSHSAFSGGGYQRNEFTEIMPILTPARPAMNCAYNVIESTKRVIMEELDRGMALTAVDGDSNIDWSLLLAVRPLVPPAAPGQSRQGMDGENVFIRIQCIPDAEGRFAKKWTGFIESRVRNLTKNLNNKLFDSTFFPFATTIRSGHVDNLFISGKYNVDFDHRQNNEDTINMVLNHFQNTIEMSGQRLECSQMCRLGLNVYYDSQIHDVLQQLEFANHGAAHAQPGATPPLHNNQQAAPHVGLPGPPPLQPPGPNTPGPFGALGAVGVAAQPIYLVNQLQQIQLININPGAVGVGALPLATAVPFVPFQHHNLAQPPTPGAGPVPSHSPHAHPHAQHGHGRGRGSPSHRRMRQSPGHGSPSPSHHAGHPRHHHRPQRRHNGNVNANGPHRGHSPHHHHQGRDAHHAGGYSTRPTRHGGPHSPYGQGQARQQMPRARQPAFPNLCPVDPHAQRPGKGGRGKNSKNRGAGSGGQERDRDRDGDRESDSNESSISAESTPNGKESATASETSVAPSETIQPLPPTLANFPNISSFPIIKIKHHQLPHLPPVVSTQNGRPHAHAHAHEAHLPHGHEHGGLGAPHAHGPGAAHSGPNNVKYALSPCASSPYMAPPPPPLPPHPHPHAAGPYDPAGQQYYAWVFVPIQHVLPRHHGPGPLQG